MTICLDSIRDCFEGAIPAAIATCAPDGTPNVTLLSQVHYVDRSHVALSFQFFSKTRENILANPHAVTQVIHPDSGAHYYLSLRYLRTETEGPLFEYMKARLAGVASHTGMSKVFHLRGSDIYEVVSIQCTSDHPQNAAATLPSRLPALRACSRRLTGHSDLNAVLDELMSGLQIHFGIDNAMVLMHDPNEARLYTVASCGYAESGVGSEVPIGAGVIGVAAQQRTPIRISFMTSDYAYSRAVRQHLTSQTAATVATEIPFPGLAAPQSQMALPIMWCDELLGVLYLESEDKMRFTHQDEDALMALADQTAMAMHFITQLSAEATAEGSPAASVATPLQGKAAVIRRYSANDSVFIDDDYLIKGVAGAIFWKLVNDYVRHQRTEFTNRELRLTPALRLPDIGDNLEARLILLQRRLNERCPFLSIVKTGRGRFSLQVKRPIQLAETEA